MQRHVALLDPFRHQCTQRGEVLRETHCCHGLGEFGSLRNPEDSQIHRDSWIGLQRTPDDPDLHRHLNASAQAAVFVGPPAGQ